MTSETRVAEVAVLGALQRNDASLSQPGSLLSTAKAVHPWGTVGMYLGEGDYMGVELPVPKYMVEPSVALWGDTAHCWASIH